MEQKASANNEKVLKNPNASEEKSEWGEMNYETNLNNISINSTSNASELQRKVEAAIANSLSAISKFKKGKSWGDPFITLFIEYFNWFDKDNRNILMGSVLFRNRYWFYKSLYDDYIGREAKLAFGLSSVLWLPHYWYGE